MLVQFLEKKDVNQIPRMSILKYVLARPCFSAQDNIDHRLNFANPVMVLISVEA